MAGGAAALTIEQDPAPFGRIADRLFVAPHEAVEGRVTRVLRAFECRNGSRDIIVGKVTPEQRFKRIRIFWNFGELSNDVIGRFLRHLDRIQNRKLGLLLQARRPAIPELRSLEHRIKNGRCIALPKLSLHPCRCWLVLPVIRKSLRGLVARAAGDSVVHRQTFIIEKLFAERCHLRGRLVAWGHGERIGGGGDSKGQARLERCLGHTGASSRRLEINRGGGGGGGTDSWNILGSGEGYEHPH